MCTTCGCGDTELVPVELHEKILAGNDRTARHNREHFVTARGCYAAVSIRSTRVGLFVLTLRDRSAEIGTAVAGWMVGEAESAATACRNLPPVTLWSSATSGD